jgi:hypothetical protein
MKWTHVVPLLLVANLAGAAEREPLSPEQEAKALVGVQLGRRGDEEVLVEGLSCRNFAEGRTVLRGKFIAGWFDRLAECQGRYVLTLEREVEGPRGERLQQVVDAVLLPPLRLWYDESQPQGPYLYYSGGDPCTLDGRIDTHFYALVHEGKGTHYTARNGILGAWGFDPAHGRIESIAPQRVVCEQADRED